MLKKDKIDDLLLQYLLNELDQETQEEVYKWTQECPENLHYFKNFRATPIRLQQTLQNNIIQGNYTA